VRIAEARVGAALADQVKSLDLIGKRLAVP
jgi:hypothetical protein